MVHDRAHPDLVELGGMAVGLFLDAHLEKVIRYEDCRSVQPKHDRPVSAAVDLVDSGIQICILLVCKFGLVVQA